MVIGVGIDIVEISRFMEIGNEERSRMFTESERLYCDSRSNPIQHYAARFAGKEAVLKALKGSGIKISYRNIEIRNRKDGSPYVNLLNTNLNNIFVPISMSHTRKNAIAIAVVENIENE